MSTVHPSSNWSSSSYDVTKFFFRHRSGRLNWKKILSIDLEYLVAHNDINLLQENVENITFSDLIEDDLYQPETHLLQLFRLSQLTIEYLLNIQNFLINENEKLYTTVHTIQHQLDASKQTLLEHETKHESLRNQVKLQGRVIKKYEKLIGSHMKTIEKLKLKEKHTNALDEEKLRIQQLYAQQAHSSSEKYPCSYCTAIFISQYYLDSHLQRRHQQQIQHEQDEKEKQMKQQNETLNITLQHDIEELEKEKQRIEREKEWLVKQQQNTPSQTLVDQLNSKIQKLIEQQEHQATEYERYKRELQERENERIRQIAVLQQSGVVNNTLRDVDDGESEQNERQRREREEREEQNRRMREEEHRRQRDALDAERRKYEDEKQRIESENANALLMQQQHTAELERQRLLQLQQREHQLLQDERARKAATSERQRQRLAETLEKRHEKKYIMFADMPFLKARYEHTEEEMKKSLIAFNTVVNTMIHSDHADDHTQNTTTTALDELHHEIQSNGYTPELQTIEKDTRLYSQQHYNIPADIEDHETQLNQWNILYEKKIQYMEELKKQKEKEEEERKKLEVERIKREKEKEQQDAIQRQLQAAAAQQLQAPSSTTMPSTTTAVNGGGHMAPNTSTTATTTTVPYTASASASATKANDLSTAQQYAILNGENNAKRYLEQRSLGSNNNTTTPAPTPVQPSTSTVLPLLQRQLSNGQIRKDVPGYNLINHVTDSNNTEKDNKIQKSSSQQQQHSFIRPHVNVEHQRHGYDDEITEEEEVEDEEHDNEDEHEQQGYSNKLDSPAQVRHERDEYSLEYLPAEVQQIHKQTNMNMNMKHHNDSNTNKENYTERTSNNYPSSSSFKASTAPPVTSSAGAGGVGVGVPGQQHHDFVDEHDIE